MRMSKEKYKHMKEIFDYVLENASDDDAELIRMAIYNVALFAKEELHKK